MASCWFSLGTPATRAMSILDDIVARKRDTVSRLRAQVDLDRVRDQAVQAPPPRDFLGALMARPTVAVIAEIKRASPSAGSINADVDILAQARLYADHGAACISVLTDEPFFRGCIDDLRQVRAAVRVPVLRKDFIIDPLQIIEARAAGADAVLLIAEILDDNALRELRLEIERWGMAALVECYTPANLQRVLASGARLIGVNNRDLNTFSVSLDHTLALASRLTPDQVLVSESGIRHRADVERLAAGGVRAILVGETLMRSTNVAATLHDLASVPGRRAGSPCSAF